MCYVWREYIVLGESVIAKPKSKAKIIESIKTERKRLYRYFPKFKPEDIELQGVVGEWLDLLDCGGELSGGGKTFLRLFFQGFFDCPGDVIGDLRAVIFRT
jgi:hypothetical protein